MNHEENIEIFGAREHNLQNIDVIIPRNKLVVITGLSGSGKSSLAFDTIYAEGQRRYLESFSAYARQFLGNMERPDVDKINGLSPVISIEQKTTNTNPRSTVGTVTEIYDFMRLLYARGAEAFSYNTGERMIKLTLDQINKLVYESYFDKKIAVLSPLVKGRKGHYRELFEQMINYGFLRVRIDGEIHELKKGLQTDRYKIHDIEVVIDRLTVNDTSAARLTDSLKLAFKHSKGSLMILDETTNEARHFSQQLMCPTTGISYDEPQPNNFSFNSPYGACTGCNGLGTQHVIDINAVIPNRKKTIKQGGIAPLGEYKDNWIFAQIDSICKQYKVTLNSKMEDIPDEALQVMLYGTDELLVEKEYGQGQKFSYTVVFEGIINFLQKQYTENPSESLRKWIDNFMNVDKCKLCDGARLRKESLYFLLGGKNISQLAQMDISDLQEWFNKIDISLSERQKSIASEIIKEIGKRIKFLVDVGVEYLTLDRTSKSLSGGESQRIRLATQIGSQLVGVLYILDEPSIGLHQRDNIRLVNSLKELRNNGNSVIVVEHDKETIMESDFVVDIGPGAGVHGGKIVAHGTPQQIIKSDTLTGLYMSEKKLISPKPQRSGNGKFIELSGANGNNLKNVNVRFPLGKLIVVSGVSGSGKSTLINETLYPILQQHFYRSQQKPLPYQKLTGIEHVDKVIEIDQSPIGRTPRSNPATYTGVFTDIRSLFAELNESKIRGYKPGWFSFNVKGGRCETCTGAGVKTIEMNFLPDVHVTCEACNGNRYNREILDVRYRGKSINDVLNMSIEHAVTFFENIPTILQKIRTLKDVGLGYITLGQSSTTLSGGEAQRVKLAAELSKKDTGNTFYILDEPTTGLHFEDVNVLLDVVHRLVDKGNTVLVIEHNMDVIKVADYIIDMGPEGGSKGGHVLCTGTPKEVAANNKSVTGQFLAKEIR